MEQFACKTQRYREKVQHEFYILSTQNEVF